MDCTSTSILYQQIGSFSKIIVDYLNGVPALEPFYKHASTLDGLIQSIESRKAFTNNRELLVEVLEEQYKSTVTGDYVQQNIRLLLGENTFTIVTAHQPNIFTGYLYFIYKILHTVKLAAFLAKEMPQYKFVPVYYMGSEDADLDELGNIYLNGEKIIWDTKQQGAVGRMNTTGLEKIIERVEGEFSGFPNSASLVSLLRECYLNSPDIQTATFKLVHGLFAGYGVVVLIPDNARLKKMMRQIFEDDLLNQIPSSVVGKSIEKLLQQYKVQATPREVNLFYLKDDIRERIVKEEDDWKVVDTTIRFTKEKLISELDEHPERFSPNVILRGLFQETILPNIAFIGGGGETAYWLELRELFEHYGVPYPVLVLRNSFLFIEKKWLEKISKLGFELPDLFSNEKTLVEQIVKKESGRQLELSTEISRIQTEYSGIQQLSTAIDSTLSRHVEALQTQAVKRLRILEKKMLSAEKKKFQAQQRQIHTIKEKLFPKNNLQERIDNFIPYYAKYGQDFITMIYEQSPALEQVFVILAEEAAPNL